MKIRPVGYLLLLLSSCVRISFLDDRSEYGSGWEHLPRTRLRDVCPPSQDACPPQGATYDFNFFCQNMIRGQTSAIADTRRNRLVLWGGHYFGNEVYALELAAQPPRLVRLNDPTIPDALCSSNCLEEIPEGVGGSPNGRATFDGLAYLPQVDRMFSAGGTLVYDCADSDATWTLDLATLEWQRMDPTDTSAGGPVRPTVGITAAYDPTSGDVFLHDQTAFWRYEYELNRYTPLYDPGGMFNFGYLLTAVIDPVRRLFMSMGEGEVNVFALDPPGGIFTPENWAGTLVGCEGLSDSTAPGLAYDPILDRIVGWPNFGDAVYLLDLDTRRCKTVTFAGGPVDSNHGGFGLGGTAGTRGHWQYFPDLRVHAVINDWDLDAVVLHLTP